VATLREASPSLIAALAAGGEYTTALRWASNKPDASERFDALCRIAQVLVDRGEAALARKVVVSAAAAIPLLGRVVETGWLSGLTALNAVHALVRFPFPDQWEGTTDDNVDLARIPLDAVLRLAPIAHQVDELGALGEVRHPFWELYGHLIPLVAVEQLAEWGQADVAAALLAQTRDEYVDDSDMAHAGKYRRAVAAAALRRFDEARASIEMLPASYQAVAYRALAKHLATASQTNQSIEVLTLIDDDIVANEALHDVIDATIELAQGEACRLVADLAFKRDWLVAGAWLLAAAGEPDLGLRLLQQAPNDDLRLGLGNRLGIILIAASRVDKAREVAALLVPAAERLMGPQWFAPETIDVEPEAAALGRGLLHLVARSGHPLPNTVTPLALVFEANTEQVADFKLGLIVDLVLARRFPEAIELAEVSAASAGASLGLATALSVGDPSTDRRAYETAVTHLIKSLNAVPLSAMLDSALGAAIRVLIDNGFERDAERLVGALLSHQASSSAASIWMLNRVKRGDAGEPLQNVLRLLVEPPLETASAQSRALLLAAVAARKAEPDAELSAATLLLADARTAAGALDVVFDVVSLHARRGLEVAAEAARSVAGGRAGELAEQGLIGGMRWDDGVTFHEVAAAAIARAVASAAMAAAHGAAGNAEAATWLTRAEALVALAQDNARDFPMDSAVGKYVDAAKVITGAEAPTDKELVRVAEISRLLWNHGEPEHAIRIARDSLSTGDVRSGLPQVTTTEEFERRVGLDAAARAMLESVVAIGAAADGDNDTAGTWALAAKQHTESSFGWAGLDPVEQSETHACVALALARAGKGDLASTQLSMASQAATMLARRGDVAPFSRLCEALAEVLPAEEANRLWVGWLVAASEAGASIALTLIATYVRWSHNIDVSSITVVEETGELLRQP
jgi:hypothetical protein